MMRMQIRVALICVLAAHIAAAASITYVVNVDTAAATGADDVFFNLVSSAAPPAISFHAYNFVVQPGSTLLPLDFLLTNAAGDDVAADTVEYGQQLDFFLTIDSPTLFTPSAPRSILNITFYNGSGLPLTDDIVFQVTPTGSVATTAPALVSISAVPEPHAAVLVASGALLLGAAFRKRFRQPRRVLHVDAGDMVL